MQVRLDKSWLSGGELGVFQCLRCPCDVLQLAFVHRRLGSYQFQNPSCLQSYAVGLAVPPAGSV